LDRIILEGLTFYGYHGAHPEERSLGQRFVVDLTLERDLRPAGEADDLALTTNYSAVYRIVRRVVEGPPCNLVEAVAERIAAAVLAEVGGAAVTVRVAKPWAPVKGMTEGRVAVEITRRPERT
jgi:dihydroneopterin aldolase